MGIASLAKRLTKLVELDISGIRRTPDTVFEPSSITIPCRGAENIVTYLVIRVLRCG